MRRWSSPSPNNRLPVSVLSTPSIFDVDINGCQGRAIAWQCEPVDENDSSVITVRVHERSERGSSPSRSGARLPGVPSGSHRSVWPGPGRPAARYGKSIRLPRLDGEVDQVGESGVDRGRPEDVRRSAVGVLEGIGEPKRTGEAARHGESIRSIPYVGHIYNQWLEGGSASKKPRCPANSLRFCGALLSSPPVPPSTPADLLSESHRSPVRG